MTKNEFEEILNKCCTQLTDEARTTVFKSSAQFENRVREVLADITENDETFQIDFNPHPQAFPDIAMGEYGVEVKFTLNDTWRSIANSVLETQRIDEVSIFTLCLEKWAECRKCAGVSTSRASFMSGHHMSPVLKLNFLLKKQS